MAFIQPFRALRPTAANAASVSSVPYDVVSTAEARALAEGNPLSFLRVTRSEIDFPPDTDPYAAGVYEKARENLAELRERAPLVVEDTPTLYCYRLRMGSHEQTGIAGCFSVDEYQQDVVKKHERTRPDKEDDRTRHITALRAQTGVVFLTYRAAPRVDGLMQQAASGTPLFDFTADDGVHHTIWAAPAGVTTQLVEAFSAIPALYIADGHHRAASAARARTALGGGQASTTPASTTPASVAPASAAQASAAPASAADTFIAVAFPDNLMQVLPYNRTIRDLAGRTPEQFLAALRERFPLAEGPASPRHKGEVSMYLAGTWYVLDMTGAKPGDESRASGLDVALLQRHVLEGLLGIGDIRTDKRVDFVGGARGTAGLERAVDSGEAAVAFSLFPVTVDDLMAISDAGGIMPPTSTWFEPKLRDGLLIHVI
jgi:uncharacterized protein (DUF1015 family)